jgi:hypothetical protein
MEQFTHKVAAIYHDQASARNAMETLAHAGFSDNQLRVAGPNDPRAERKLEPEGKEIPKTIVKDTAVGAGVGGVLGLAGSATLGAAGMALFLSQPVAATLAIAGYAAGVGGLVGFLKGIKVKEGVFVGAAEDALKQGYWALVVHCRTADEEQRAHELIASTVVEKELSS